MTKKEYYSERGMYHFYSENFSAAVDDFTKAIEISPHFLDYEVRGVCHKKLGNYSAAIKDFTKVIEMSEDFSETACLERGKIYLLLGKYQEAVADFEKFLANCPPQFKMQFTHYEFKKFLD